MASFHCEVDCVSRSAGRSATAAAAYRSAERIACEREGRVHDYRPKQGVVHAEIVAPADAPDWMRDREALWNGAEAAENRKNSVVAREWEIALPHEIDADARCELALDFAQELVQRYGVVADVSVHLPHRDGDQRNHHAHVLTTTRQAAEDGFGAKTRVLDVKQTSKFEVIEIRKTWEMQQNRALERAGVEARVDHRSLEVQRQEAEAERDRIEKSLSDREMEGSRDSEWESIERDHAIAVLNAAALDRPPEIKLGPVTSAIERKAERRAEAAGRPYEPVTDRGAEVHAVREQKSLFRDAVDTLKEMKGNVVEAVRETALWVRDLWDRKDEHLSRREGVQERLQRLRDDDESKEQDRSSAADGERRHDDNANEFRPIQRDGDGRVKEDLSTYLKEAERWRQSREVEPGKERDENERDR